MRRLNFILLVLTLLVTACDSVGNDYGIMSDSNNLSRGTSENTSNVSGYICLNIMAGEDINKLTVPMRRMTPELASNIARMDSSEMRKKITDLTLLIGEETVDAYIDNNIQKAIDTYGVDGFMTVKNLLYRYMSGEKERIRLSVEYKLLDDGQLVFLEKAIDFSESVSIPLIGCIDTSAATQKTAQDCYNEAIAKAVIYGCGAAFEALFSGGTLSVLSGIALVANLYSVYLEYEVCLKYVRKQ